MRIPALLLLIPASLCADTFEIAMAKAQQSFSGNATAQSSTWDPHSFRIGLKLHEDNLFTYRLEASYSPEDHRPLIEPSTTRMAFLASSYCAAGLVAETWQLSPYAAPSVAFEVRRLRNQLSNRPGKAFVEAPESATQGWFRIGGTVRLRGAAHPGSGHPSERGWYPFARFEFGMAITRKGSSDADALMGRRETTFSLGLRF